MRALIVATCALFGSACAAPPANEPSFEPLDAPRAYLGLGHRSLGSMTYDFRVPPRTRRLDVEFAQSLRGARVDADASAWGRTFPILRDRRVGKNLARLDWDVGDVEQISITIHHHFRERPVVRRWQFWAPAG
jgi:hypothetical protein